MASAAQQSMQPTIAAPAQYRVIGVKTFLVSQDGVLYQKDFGPSTLDEFNKMERFNTNSLVRLKQRAKTCQLKIMLRIRSWLGSSATNSPLFTAIVFILIQC